MEPEGSLPHLQMPDTSPILSQINPVHAPTCHFLNTAEVFFFPDVDLCASFLTK
jgi:hypothetical protein